MTDEDKIITVDLKLEKIDVEDGKVYIVSKSLTKDFEPEYVLEMLAEASKNKHYIWRHRHPITKKHTLNHIYADVKNSWVEDGILYSRYEMFDHTMDHLAYIDLIKERQKIDDPLGLSMRYRKYSNAKGVVEHTDVFEHSGTPFPKCLECGTTEVGVIEMTNENENKDKDKKSCKKEENKMDEKQLEESRKKIEDLEALLNSKTEQFEKLEAKIVTLESENKAKEDDLDKAERTGKTLEESVNELEATVTYLLKKPLIDEILELDSELPDEMVEWYKTQKEEFLEGEIKRLTEKANSKPVIKSQEKSAEEALENAGKKEDEKFVTIGDKKIMKEELFEYVTQDLNIKRKGEK